MVVEEFINFWEWIGPAFGWFFIILCIYAVLGTIYGFMVSAVRNGPSEAFYSVALVIGQAAPDLLRTSPRRVFALSKLAVQEAMRRRIILVTFAIFAIALLVGGWFLDVRSDRPHEIYMSFVLNGTQLLVLLVAIMISCFSLPQDIRNKTIYTVVTKPVRPLEIILGRIFGFGFMVTVLLLSMGILSYAFVLAGLRHSHEIELASFEEVNQQTGITPTGRRASINAVLEGAGTLAAHHRHRVEVVLLENEEEGDDQPYRYALRVLPIAGHRHDTVRVVGDRPDYLSENGVFTFDDADGYKQILELFSEDDIGSRMRIEFGSAQGYLQARIPKYANLLRFQDYAGNPTNEGVSVGDEWEYRSYIEGGTSQARAIFEFDGFHEEDFAPGDTIPLELTLGVFRTHMGNIERRVTGTITLKSTIDDIEYESEPLIFESEEFQVQELQVPRTVRARWVDAEGEQHVEEMDLFDDFARDGEIEVWLRCNESGQFFGVARADVYFRQAEGAFWVNFVKGYLSIWLQVLIMVSLGVMFSTFVTGPVAMLGSIAMMVVMLNTGFIHDIATNGIAGGGPLEASWRLVTQSNVTMPLEGGITLTVVQSVDLVLTWSMDIIANSLPDLTKINTMEALTRGYDISIHSVGSHIVMTLGFCFVMAMVSYFRIKTREIAA